jgi:protein-tyrosine-phosphatase
MLLRGYEPLSAGTKPISKINPFAVQVMNEIGTDISRQKSKDLTEEMIRNADKVINMGCMDNDFCPKVIDWRLQIPKINQLKELERSEMR